MEDDMEDKDKQLNELLKKWEAPPAPPTLRFPGQPRQPWWRWWLTGSIRVPVPAVGLAALALVVWYWQNRPPEMVSKEAVSLADFRPVEQFEPRIIRSVTNENR